MNLFVQLMYGMLYIDRPGESYKVFASVFFEKGIASHLSNLISSLTLAFMPDEDLKILSHDSKFMRLLEETKSMFDATFQKFLESRKNS